MLNILKLKPLKFCLRAPYFIEDYWAPLSMTKE